SAARAIDLRAMTARKVRSRTGSTDSRSITNHDDTRRDTSLSITAPAASNGAMGADSPNSRAMTADVAIIGAGIVGSSTALELSRRGLDVLVVDKAGGAGMGSTSASSAIIRFNYSTFAGVAVSWESKFRWVAWEEHLGYRDPDGLARFHRCGKILLDVP